jgi:hypothetical protein
MSEQDKVNADMLLYGTGTSLNGKHIPRSTVHVETKFNKDRIEQQIIFEDCHSPIDMIDNVAVQVMNLQEQGVRVALIKLGWTPPETKNKVMDILKSLEIQNDGVSDMRIRHAISQCVVDIREELQHGNP